MRKKSIKYTYQILLLMGTTLLSYFLEPLLGYRAIGIIFLLAIFFVGITGSIFIVFLSALFSALLWNFLFIPPKFTFAIRSSDDSYMYLAFFVVAMISGYLTKRINEEQRLKDSEALYKTLFNSISHEMRTPLTTLLASGAALNEETILQNPLHIKSVATGIMDAANRLNRIISNLLDMSRLDSGVMSLKLEWHDVDDLIGVVTSKLSQELIKHKLHIQLPEKMPLVRIDFNLMEHALANLISNAIMYTPENTVIFIKVSTSGNYLEISVEDQGPGIPCTDKNKIFQKFYRIPGTPAGGIGLGLSIVKNIIELHDGFITVENLTPQGAKFSLFLPTKNQPRLPQESAE